MKIFDSLFKRDILNKTPKKSQTRIQLRMNSNSSSMGGFWESGVTYDAWGTPYGLDHWSIPRPLRLHKNGKTADHWLYGTEWKHISGSPVEFPD